MAAADAAYQEGQAQLQEARAGLKQAEVDRRRARLRGRLVHLLQVDELCVRLLAIARITDGHAPTKRLESVIGIIGMRVAQLDQ